MVQGKSKDKNSYRGELGGQLGFMRAIGIMESILYSTTHVVNRCDNISALIRATIHPEGIKPIWKQVDLISHLSDVYQSMYSGMSLVKVYRHQNIGRPASTSMLLESLKVILNALVEHIMEAFLLSSATRNMIAIGISDPHGILSV